VKEVKATYSTKELTNRNVEVTLTANEDVQSVEGFTKVELAVSVTSTFLFVSSFVLYVALTSGAVLSILVTSTVTTVLFPAIL